MDGVALVLLGVVCGLVGTLVGAGAVWWQMQSSFVTKAQCGVQHQAECQNDAALRKDLHELKAALEQMSAKTGRDFRIVFQMVRKIIVRLGVPPEEMDAILNVQGD